jgi:acyl-CoA dehydrogenase
MSDRSFLDWPFFDDSHRQFAAALDAWAATALADHDDTDLDAACRQIVTRLGQAG